MCGLVGYLGPPLPDAPAALTRAAATLRHRGPDDSGFWEDPVAGIALSHRRLSILDLSSAGRQPMHSRCGRWVIAFNGEIYNHLELRARLSVGPGPAGGRGSTSAPWGGHSDTETLLAAFSAWGVERALDVLEGMFAIAAWDRQERRLYLARDRMGEKPLYYGWVGKGFGFGSELKALRALPGFEGTVDRTALAAFMRSNYVPGERSIYSGIAKLRPGTWLSVSLFDIQRRVLPEPVAYWNFAEVARSARRERMTFQSDEEAIQSLESTLSKAVKSQMISDVPLGAFLSGGIDSSTVVALMQSQSNRPVKTFSIGFFEKGFDEAVHARSVAEHLGTDHTELYVDDVLARGVIPDLPTMYCEPFADSSQIPTYLVSRLARQQVTVSLSGDGGDELFAGYGRYHLAEKIWSRLRVIPRPVRRVAAAAIRMLPAERWNTLILAAGWMLPDRFRTGLPGDKLHKGAQLLACNSFSEFLSDGFASYWRPSEVMPDIDEGETRNVLDEFDDFGVIERMMIGDSIGYLPDDILVKVDRAAMAVGLETRVPLLDRQVVEFAWRLPFRYKVRGGQAKWLLRQLLYRHVPQELIDRPKMGFGVPIDAWLRGPLREWAGDLLDEGRLRREGFFDPGPIAQRWREHLSGSRNWQYPLWGVLMFEAWLEAQE